MTVQMLFMVRWIVESEKVLFGLFQFSSDSFALFLDHDTNLST